MLIQTFHLEDDNAYELKKEEAEVQSKMSKVDEEIQSHKQHKKFLDLIAIAAGEKKPVN